MMILQRLITTAVLLQCLELKLSSAQPQQQQQQLQPNVLNQMDHVSMTKEAASIRSQHLSKKKPILAQSDASLTSLLFPGTDPEEYIQGDAIPMFVDNVESRRSPATVEYYKLPVCKEPTKSSLEIDGVDSSRSQQMKSQRKNLGQRLMGHSTKPLSYQISALENKGCTVLCHVSIPAKPLRLLRRLIRKQYRVHFSLDEMPILIREYNHALRGYPLGFVQPNDNNNDAEENNDGAAIHGHIRGLKKDSDEVYLYNHLRFTIYYNQERGEEASFVSASAPPNHITGFDVVPVSIRHKEPDSGWSEYHDQYQSSSPLATCDPSFGPVLNRKEDFLALRTDAGGEDLNVVYSYEIEWKPSEVKWADRWDIYLMETPDNEIHYFAIVNSLMIGFLLCGTVAAIMIRALRKDIAQYNEYDFDEIAAPVEESGWKLVHGDVFRPPRRGRTLLSVAVGTGLQIGTSVFLTLSAAVLRLLNPMNKGQILSCVVISYVLSGSVAGYSSARLFKYFAGKAWKRTTVLTAAAFPGVVLSVFIALNCGLYISLGKASTSVSFLTILIVFLLWLCVSTPLVFVGSYFGYRSQRIEVPTKTNQIARFVPDSRSWFVKFPHSILLAGILPFGSVCIELSFIMGALWLHQIYYIMGFILIVCAILTISCSTISMVFCYVQLCNEDYKWWWKSFYNCASIGFYLFAYSLWYLCAKLEFMGVLPCMLYIAYMGIICFAFALYCGGVGVVSSFWFTRKIYAAVKVD